MNKKADKAAVFAGWRDMNDYMRENKIDAVTPVLAGAPPAQVAKGDADTDDDAKPETVADKLDRKPAAAAAAKPRKPSNS